MVNNFYKKFSLWLVAVVFIFTSIVMIKPDISRAFIVTDISNLLVNIKDSAFKIGEKALNNIASVLFKNTTKYFLNQLAYNAATSLVEGGTGKTPLFPKLMIGDMLQQAAGDALGEFIDTVAQDGFAGFDICNPASIKTTLDITLPAFQEANPGSWDAQGAGYKAKCSWQDIRKRWTDFKEAAYADPKKYLFGLTLQFKDGANDIDISAKVRSQLLSDKQNKEAQEKVKVIANQYINPVVSPISKFIKTPSSVVRDTFSEITGKSTAPELVFTGNLLADAVGIFTNTLAAKLQQKIMTGLSENSLPQSRVTLNQLNVINIGLKYGGSDPFADFKKINVARVDGGNMDLFEKFSSERLAMQGDNALTKGPGYTSEVLPDSFLLAARQELTVKQAIDQSIINPNIQVGFTTQKLMSGPVPEDYIDADIKNDDGKWPNDLAYRSLVISRIHRVLPQSWELAALFWRYYDNTNNKALTLQRLIDCYADSRTSLSPYGTPYNEDPRYPENCRVDMNGNNSKDDLNPMIDYNPYFHLVDPNWVLKLPVNKCSMKGAGPEVIFQSIMCSEDNIDAGENAKPGGSSSASVAISRGEGTPICDAEQAKKIGIDTNAGIKYDMPTKTITRDDNYCADWQTCINESDGGKCQAYGYCVEEKSVTKLNADSCAYPLGTDNGLYSSCDKFQIAGQSYNLIKNSLQRCSDSDAGCKQYSTQMVSGVDKQYSWSFSNAGSSVYLNSQAIKCDETNDGCTKVAEYKTGTNLLYNGDFTSGDYDGNGFSPTGWVLPENVDITLCSFSGKYNNEEGATLASELPEGCSVKNESPVLINSEYTYSFEYEFIAESEANILVSVKGVNSSGEVIKTETITPTSSTKWLKVSQQISIGPNNQAWEFPLETTGILVEFERDSVAGKVGLRDVKLSIVNGPLVDIGAAGQQQSVSTRDYHRTSLSAYKLPPDYLQCNLYYQKLNNSSETDCLTNNGVWNVSLEMCAVGGSQMCEKYAPLCMPQDVGCQLFKSEDGLLEVPAKVSGDDVCPVQCVGYDSYSRQPSFFEANEYPVLYSTASACQNAGGYWDVGKSSCQAQPTYVNLIPSSANQCSAEAVGCQSFTNLAYASSGGEQQAYFSFLRPCVTESTTNTTKVFYTWEGSDTSGYQLKKWTRLMSNNGFGPCTNVDADTGACLDSGDVNVWSKGPGSGNKAVCSPEDLLTNSDCRDFFDINDRHYYVLQSKTIITKDPKLGESCVSFRNDASGKVYNADLTDAVRCNAQSVGCRMFKGGTSNNVTTLVNYDFESGTIGNWINAYGNTTNLSISNESLRQGGLSLAAGSASKKVIYTDSAEIIKNNKEYTLVFLAKKINMTNVGGSLEDPDTDELSFSLDGNLQTEWREYKVGPIVANNVSATSFSLKINNLSNNEGYLIDEIRLIEGRDVYYLIDKSWTIPVACDNQINNAEGCDANGENCGERRAVGAQMGCNYYLDKNEQKVSIKSFTQLCSPSAVNCQAFVNTFNSESPVAYTKKNICDNTNGVIKNGSCIMNGVAVCQTTGNSCEYSSANVPADKLVYFAPESRYACDRAYAGCMALGMPKYDLTQVPAPIKEFETVYLINNPDKYSDILCSASGLLCELMVGTNSGQGVYVSPIGSDESNSRLCIFDKAKNRWVQKLNPDKDCELDNPVPASERTAYMTPYVNSNYRGWVGMCEEEFVGCKELRNPEQAVSPGMNWCDASINASDYGECDTTKGDVVITNGFGSFCQKKLSGIDHTVCKLTNNATKCNYTANSDWFCFAKEGFVNGRDQDANCKINNNDVCVITSNGNGVQNDGYCTYSPLCKSVYAIEKSIKKCDSGMVDRGSGCAPFFDVAQATVSGSAQATKDKGTLVSCDPNAKPGDEKYCNTNVILQNRLTRQCSEWLYCTSGAVVDGKSVCYDVGRCSEADPTNPNNCKKPSVKTKTTVANQTFDFTNAFERENLRNLTGFSHAGIRWSSDKVIEGYSAPESMNQSTSYTKLSNGDFETVTSDSDNLQGWQLSGNGCELPSDSLFDGTDSWDGFYSLKLSVRNQGYCQLQSNSGKDFDNNNIRYLSLNPSNRYVISFAGRSSTGKQIATVGMKYYDNFFNDCAIDETKYNSLPNIFVKGIYEYLVTLNDNRYYYNKYCIDKAGNQKIPTGQIPSWIKGQAEKTIVLKQDWQKYAFALEVNSQQLSMPKNASYGRIIIKAPEKQEIDGVAIGASGTVWLDNIALDSSLQVSAGRYVSTMCRLYPSADAKQCSYTKFNKLYQGLEGYCLEEDPHVPGQCLQWFPVDVAGGNSIYTSGEDIQAYDNRPSLYMCVASRGNNDFYYSTAVKYTQGGVTYNDFGLLWSETFMENERDQNVLKVMYDDTKKSPQDWTQIKFEDIESVEVLLQKPGDECDDGHCDDWGNIYGWKKLYVDNAKLGWWYGGATNGGDSPVYKDNSGVYGNFGYTSYEAYRNFASGRPEVCSFDDGGITGCNMAGVSFVFDPSSKKLDKIQAFAQDGSGNEGGFVIKAYNIKLKESCELIAQVVNENGDNKVNQSNYNSGFGIYGTSTDKLPFLKNMPTSPFASLNIDSGVNATPDQWPEAYVPFNFANNVSSMPLSTLKSVSFPTFYSGICQKVKDEATDKAFQGGVCEGEKVANQNGEVKNVCAVCVGLGKRIYNNNGGLSLITPTRCDTSTNNQNCLPVQGLYHPVEDPQTDGLYKTGVDRLKKLFAKVFKWYKLTVNDQGKPVYVETSAETETGLYKDISNQGLPGKVGPIVVGGNNIDRNVIIDAPGSSQAVTFKVDIPDAQLPIRKIVIDWGDGSNPTEFYGEFNERNRTDNPFSFTHWYGCVPTADGNRCRLCNNGSASENGSCQYNGPKVMVQDNWDWCAVGHNQTSSSALVQTKYGLECSSQPQSDDFIQYGGKIIIRPR